MVCLKTREIRTVCSGLKQESCCLRGISQASSCTPHTSIAICPLSKRHEQNRLKKGRIRRAMTPGVTIYQARAADKTIPSVSGLEDREQLLFHTLRLTELYYLKFHCQAIPRRLHKIRQHPAKLVKIHFMPAVCHQTDTGTKLFHKRNILLHVKVSAVGTEA